MATKEDLHKLKISQIIAPQTGTPNAVLTTTYAAMDTQGYESNMLALSFGTGQGTDIILAMNAQDTDTTTAGVTVTGRDVIFAVADNTAAYLGTGTLANNIYPAVGQWVQSTGTLTATTAPNNKTFLFAYTGTKRYIRITASVGATSAPLNVLGIQGHFRYRGRGGLYVEPYAAQA
jgi:hypothetical protein